MADALRTLPRVVPMISYEDVASAADLATTFSDPMEQIAVPV